MNEKIPDELYELFAGALEYPVPLLARGIEQAALSLEPRCPEASELLRAFGSYLEQAPEGEAEETYTATFDLCPSCPPYIGYHLFGDEHPRGIFMARLKECYRSCGLPDGGELPDHVSTMLRFLARNGGEALSAELLKECIVPALAKMAGTFEGSPNPYGKVVRSLFLVLTQREAPSPVSRGEAEAEEENSKDRRGERV